MEYCNLCGNAVTSIGKKPCKYFGSKYLSNVILAGIEQYTCPSCEAAFAEIPPMEVIHREVGKEICLKRLNLLSPDEIKFIRSELGWKSLELAAAVGISRPVLSSWEKGNAYQEERSDRLIRLIYLSRFNLDQVPNFILFCKELLPIRPDVYNTEFIVIYIPPSEGMRLEPIQINQSVKADSSQIDIPTLGVPVDTK